MKKNILLISEVFKKGGAGNATSNFLDFFSEYYNAKLIVPYTKNKKKNIINYYNNFSYLFYIFYKLFNRITSFIFSNNKFYFFNKLTNGCLFDSGKIKKKIKDFKPDIVIILWFEYILDYKEVLKIKNELKCEIVFIPFDMFNFTGGCRYTQSCENFKKECNNCPALGKKFANHAKNSYAERKKYLNNIKAKFIFPSTFAKNFAFSTKIIDPNIIYEIINYPTPSLNKNFPISNNSLLKKIKKRLTNKKIIFLGAQDLREWRKGMHNFMNIISILKTNHKGLFKNLLIISAGKNASKIFSNYKENFIFFESLSLKNLYGLYQISDLIIIPSLQEWSSLMMSEASSLEKTIFAFKTGSSEDLIINNFNGYVFDYYDYNSVVKKIVSYFSNPSNFYIKKSNKFIKDLRNKCDNKAIKNKLLKFI
jgi:glycosyltransferase involved in cell wall biosynthesis